MARQARVAAVGIPHHVTQRGNDRQDIFLLDDYRRRYPALLGEHGARQLRTSRMATTDSSIN